ncbi:MAG: DUF4421 family protein [Bdellovibrionales bacterium]
MQAVAEENPAIDKPQVAKPNVVKEIFENFEDAFRLQGILEFPEYSFYLGGPAIQGVAYVPSFGPKLGPRILWKEIGVTMTFALPMPEVEKNRRGVSDQTEVILNSYWRQNAIDLYYLRVRGFYIASPWQEFSVHKPERYPQVPDAVATSFGFNWYYVLHPERYSLKAAFDQSEFQKESGGSWLASPFYNHFELSLGTRFVPGIGDDHVTGLPNLASGRFDTLGTSFGYGYTYIYGRFFASALAAVGPGVEYQKIGRSDGSGDVKNVSLAIKINVNGAMGFNFKNYIGGVKFLLDSLSANVSGTEVASNLVSGQVFFGARF